MSDYLEHPSEEALERFLLNQCRELELETVETHILACDSCVTRLEVMETELAVTKTALAGLQRNVQKKSSREKRSWRAWIPVPTFSFAAAAAVAALCFVAFFPAQVNLAVYRGVESSVVPEWRPLDVHLNAGDLADGTVAVQLVNERGAELWKGNATVHQEQAEVHLPRFTAVGNYFLRLYEPAKDGQGDLLREFAFQVK